MDCEEYADAGRRKDLVVLLLGVAWQVRWPGVRRSTTQVQRDAATRSREESMVGVVDGRSDESHQSIY